MFGFFLPCLLFCSTSSSCSYQRRVLGHMWRLSPPLQQRHQEKKRDKRAHTQTDTRDTTLMNIANDRPALLGQGPALCKCLAPTFLSLSASANDQTRQRESTLEEKKKKSFWALCQLARSSSASCSIKSQQCPAKRIVSLDEWTCRLFFLHAEQAAAAAADDA